MDKDKIYEKISVLVNIIVFGVTGWILVLITEGLMVMYPNLNPFFKICWIIGIGLIWTNSWRVNWVAMWKPSEKKGKEKNDNIR